LPRLAWNNAERLAMYELNHYFDLSRDEEKVWRPRIESLVTNLQTQAAPDLIVFLQHSRDAVRTGLTEKKVASLLQEWEELRIRHFSPLTAQAAEYLDSLDESNVAYLRKRLSDSLKREEKVLALNDEEFARKRISRLRQQFERFYGRITTVQAKALENLPGLSRKFRQDHIAQTGEAQQSLLAVTGRMIPRDEIKNRLDQWVHDPASMRTTESGRASYREERRILIKNIAAMDRLMSSEQRNNCVGKLDEWQKDLMNWLKDF